METQKLRIYVGADRSQALAVSVLEHSIKRHTKIEVEVIPMIDLAVPQPSDPRNWQRTGFSFSRFCIPELAGFNGRAIYMDADMLVFKDIQALWDIQMEGRYVLVQESVKHTETSLTKENAPTNRKKQCAVMVLDCSSLAWNVREIVSGLDNGQYSYPQLMDELCIVSESKVGYSVPFEWNSLEHLDSTTCLLHYTDMGTQPWVYVGNSNGEVWFEEVRQMLKKKKLSMLSIEEEVQLGFFRPSLIWEIKYGSIIPRIMRPWFNRIMKARDVAQGFVAHKEVYAQKRIRNKAIKDFERNSSQPDLAANSR
jgi:lipopolysaccharide biosynthesis glycosyltransferase